MVLVDVPEGEPDRSMCLALLCYIPVWTLSDVVNTQLKQGVNDRVSRR
jgi:hypothetical protein